LGKVDRDIKIIVKRGFIESIKGGKIAKQFRKLLKNELYKNVAELGIGTNDKAKRPDNILETEKILGTVHIALGDNSSFGGKVSVPFHEDYIFFKPNLEVLKNNGKVELLIDGEPQF
jgi:leucyl aminopeptidase (aminopeptidase T)